MTEDFLMEKKKKKKKKRKEGREGKAEIRKQGAFGNKRRPRVRAVQSARCRMDDLDTTYSILLRHHSLARFRSDSNIPRQTDRHTDHHHVGPENRTKLAAAM